MMYPSGEKESLSDRIMHVKEQKAAVGSVIDAIAKPFMSGAQGENDYMYQRGTASQQSINGSRGGAGAAGAAGGGTAISVKSGDVHITVAGHDKEGLSKALDEHHARSKAEIMSDLESHWQRAQYAQ